MGKDILKKESPPVVKRPAEHDIEIQDRGQNTTPFISFRYSYREVSSNGGTTYIKSRDKSFENGKFKSEEFEGTLDGNVYSNLLSQVQKHFLDQMALFMKPFSMFLPFVRSRDEDK